MSSYDFNVTLYRDSLSTPWGFRLEGGRDFQAPLTIQRVFTGSPASGDLQRGDIILVIQNKNASQLTHQEANDIIKHCGGSINLSVRRRQTYSGSNTLPRMQSNKNFTTSLPFTSPPPVNRSLYNNVQNNLFHAEDPLSSYIRSRPIEKVKDPRPILSQTGSPIMPGAAPSMSNARTSVKRYQPTHTLPILAKLPTTFESSAPSHGSFGLPSQPIPYFPPPAPYVPPAPQPSHNKISVTHTFNNTAAPFNDKRMAHQIQHSLTRAVQNHNAHAGSNYNQPQPQPQHHVSFAPSVKPKPVHVQPHKPAQQQVHYADDYSNYGSDWKDSLKRTGINLYEDQQQPSSQNYDYQNQPKSPKVVNLQYNSPIGLYSKQNIQEELYKKVGSQPDLHMAPSSEF